MSGAFEDRLRRTERKAEARSYSAANEKVPPCEFCGRRAGALIVRWPSEDADAGCRHCENGLVGEVEPTIVQVQYDPPLEENRDPWG